MLTKTIILLVILFNIVIAQLNGEFWWLHDKVKQLNGVEIPPAKFEELSEFDNDENDKVVFDNEVNVRNKVSGKNQLGLVKNGINRNKKVLTENDKIKPEDMIGGKTETEKTMMLHFANTNSLEWQHDFVNKENMTKYKLNNEKVKTIDNAKDEFKFHFPDEVFKDSTKYIINKPSPVVESKPFNYLHDKITFKLHNDDYMNRNSERICTYIAEKECRDLNGFVYKHKKRASKLKYTSSSPVCCIVPIKPEPKSPKFIFPATKYDNQNLFRFPRSTKNEDIIDVGLNQRKALLNKRYSSYYQQTIKPMTPQAQVTQRIVTPYDEYEEDPYANIKNHNFKTQRPRPYPINPKPNCGVETYDDDDYTDELPKPGLVGIYSDTKPHPGSWAFINGENEDVGDEGIDYGYGVAVANPRLDNVRSSTTANPKRKSTIKILLTSSEESKDESDIATVSYKSQPNFQVLQGFKLFNVVRDKGSYNRNSRKSTTESVNEDSYETVHVHDADDADYDDFGDTDKRVFKSCGRVTEDQSMNERQTEGEARQRSNPWLVLVVRTRREKTTLCHATLVHPRAAVTAANCVYGAVPGEVVIRAGIWDINDDTERTQQRMATVHRHSRYNHPELAHNIAVLYWNRALRLNVNVQPICLSDLQPDAEDSCFFAGWGGKGQAIHNRPRWQRASIVPAKECGSFLMKHRGERLPKDAFCATTMTQGCVTGIGGALVCSSNGKKTAVGVVIWRKNCDVTSPFLLLSAQEWVQRVLTGLGIV